MRFTPKAMPQLEPGTHTVNLQNIYVRADGKRALVNFNAECSPASFPLQAIVQEDMHQLFTELLEEARVAGIKGYADSSYDAEDYAIGKLDEHDMPVLPPDAVRFAGKTGNNLLCNLLHEAGIAESFDAPDGKTTPLSGTITGTYSKTTNTESGQVYYNWQPRSFVNPNKPTETPAETPSA